MMDGLETEVDALRYNSQGYGSARPVNFKSGVNIQDLKKGVDFEIPDNPDEAYTPDNEHPSEELEKGEPFFDDEELFRNLNFGSITQPGTYYTVDAGYKNTLGSSFENMFYNRYK